MRGFYSESLKIQESSVVVWLTNLLSQGPSSFEITILPSCPEIIHDKKSIPSRPGERSVVDNNGSSDDDIKLRLKQSIVLIDGHLGMDGRALPWVTSEIRRLYRSLKQRQPHSVNDGSDQLDEAKSMIIVTSCLLLVNPDHATAWADRRRSFQVLSRWCCCCQFSSSLAACSNNNMETFAFSDTRFCGGWWNFERIYLNLLMTQHSKAPTSWAHRKYVIKMLLQNNMEAYEANHCSNHWKEAISNSNRSANCISGTNTSFGFLLALARKEFYTCAVVAEKFPKNYYAWTHRRLFLGMVQTKWYELNQTEDEGRQRIETQRSSFVSLLQEEWLETVSWLETHLSDHSAVHHGGQVLQIYIDCFLMMYKDIDHNSNHGSNNVDASTAKMMEKALESSRSLVIRFPSHEALWMFRRIVVAIVWPYAGSVTIDSGSGRSRSRTMTVNDKNPNFRSSGDDQTNLTSGTLADEIWECDIKQIFTTFVNTKRDLSATSLNQAIDSKLACSYLLWVLAWIKQQQPQQQQNTSRRAAIIAKDAALMSTMYDETLANLQEVHEISHCKWRH